MSSGDTGQAKPIFGGFGVSTASKAVGAGIAQQNVTSEPTFLFGTKPAPSPFTFGQNAAPNPAGTSVTSEKNMFGPINAASSSNTSAITTSSVTQPLNSDNERFWCTACKKSVSRLSQEFFCCSSCSQFYHCRCANMFVSSGIVQLVNYFGLDICQYCHVRLQYTTPAPFPITRPLCHARANEIEEDERPMPRKSSRDPKEIPRSQMPDQVAIIAEHFATESAALSLNPTSDTRFDDLDEPMIEALFEANDLVTLLILPREHPDHNRSFKIVARHFNSREYPEENDDGGMDIGSTEKDTYTDNGVTNNLEEDAIDDFLGKAGWFYKLDRNPQSDIAMLPNVVLWHEDDLELALDDDSNEEEDLEMNDTMETNKKEDVVVEEVTIKEETIVEETIIEEVIVNKAHPDA